MEFKDIADIIHTGGQGALLVIVWFVYLGAKKISTAIDCLETIRDELKAARADTREIAKEVDRKLDAIHNAVIEMPMNVFRSNK